MLNCKDLYPDWDYIVHDSIKEKIIRHFNLSAGILTVMFTCWKIFGYIGMIGMLISMIKEVMETKEYAILFMLPFMMGIIYLFFIKFANFLMNTVRRQITSVKKGYAMQFSGKVFKTRKDVIVTGNHQKHTRYIATCGVMINNAPIVTDIEMTSEMFNVLRENDEVQIYWFPINKKDMALQSENHMYIV